MSDPQAYIQPEQCDREMAADYLAFANPSESGQVFAARVRANGHPAATLVQAFARARVAAYNRGIEDAACKVDAERVFRRLNFHTARAIKKKSEARDFETMAIAHSQSATAIRSLKKEDGENG